MTIFCTGLLATKNKNGLSLINILLLQNGVKLKEKILIISRRWRLFSGFWYVGHIGCKKANIMVSP